jgi:NAD(P)H-flavin reductase
MQTVKSLTPESLTAVEILEGIDKVHRDQALEMLRNFVNELYSEQKWQELLSKSPEPMINFSEFQMCEYGIQYLVSKSDNGLSGACCKKREVSYLVLDW